MADTPLTPVLRHVRSLAGLSEAAGPADAELLERFARRRDADAFAALVGRHGPLVWRVCRRLLGNAADADDAFQATFLVLARRPGAVRKPGSLASWLHGTACRVAAKARARGEKRRARERQAARGPAPDPVQEAAWRELGRVVEEEVHRLAENYRLPLLLCYWEGRSHEEAARQLGWPCGTVKTRLTRARELLHGRLARRGVSLPAGVVALLLAPEGGEAAVPAGLVAATASAPAAAPGGVSARVAALADAGLKVAAGTRAKAGLALLLAGGVVAAGVGVASNQEPAAGQREVRQEVGQGAERRIRTDRHGDPLPDRALLRLGSTRLRHGGPVTSVAFLPGGGAVVSASFDGTVRVWEAATGKKLRQIESGQGLVVQAALSPDGRTLATAGQAVEDCDVRLWDVATGRQLRRLGPYGFAIPSVTFSADGKTLAAPLVGDRTVRLWDVPSGREVHRLKVPEAACRVAFSPDGKTLATGGYDEPVVRLWDLAAGAEVRRLGEPEAGKQTTSIRALAFSPDGQTLATTDSRDKAIRLWDVAAGTERRRLWKFFTSFGPILFSPDGKLLAAGAETISLWDVDTGKAVRRLDGHYFGNPCLAFSPDGKSLASGTNDCTVRLWDVATGRDLCPTPGHQGRVLSLAHSPDGRTLATAGLDRTIRLWDPASGEPRRVLSPGAAVYQVAFTPDGRLLAAAGGDRTVRLLDVETGKEVRRLHGFDSHGFYGASLAVSPDGRAVAASGADRTVRVWDVATGEERHRFREPGGMNVAAFTPDGKGLVSVSSTGERREAAVCLRDLATGKELRRWQTPQRLLSAAAVSPDGRLLAVAGQDEGLRVWDLATGKERSEFRPPTDAGVSSAVFSRDGRVLALGWERGTVSLVETATGKERCRLDGGQSLSLFSVSLAPDGRTVASAGGDSTTLVWDLAGRASAGELSRLDPEQAWDRLGGGDAGAASEAVTALAADAGRGVPFLRGRLRPAAGLDPARAARLVADLDGDHFEARERAAAELEGLGEAAAPALRKALAGRPSAEVRRRAEELLEKLEGPVTSPETLRGLRAVEALERAGTPEARRVLEALAGGAPEARLTREAKASLGRLAPRPGPADGTPDRKPA